MQFKDASPTEYLENLNLPMLLFSDHQTYKYATVFENKIREETEYLDFEMVHAHKFDHGQIWHNLAEKNSIYRSMIIDFIHTNSR